jgi:ribosomal protein L11 methyltransferase
MTTASRKKPASKTRSATAAKSTTKPRASKSTAKAAPAKKLDEKRFSWRKLSAAKWADAWLERLSFLGPTRVMVIEFPNAPKVRVEAHGLKQKEADELVKMFGGQISEAKWLTLENPPLRAPIRIREKLLVVSTEKERDEALAEKAKRKVLLIPAGMAFGTGEHETTVTCLRFLADIAEEQGDKPWEVLDLGTGTGILALASREFGARTAEGHDFDPHAVRTAKENVRINAVKQCAMKKVDVRKWQPTRTWEVVVANLFSGLLMEVAPKIAAATSPGGNLVFSGVLREQEDEVVRAFKKAGFKIEKIIRRSKWIAGRARRSRK